jgi:FAD:protein FMN transferase
MGCLTNAPDDSAWERFEYVEPEMGVDFHLKFYAPNRQEAERIAKTAYARVEALNGIFSDYAPGSELSRLSRAQIEEPVRVSSELFDILQRAQALARDTRGAFDITAGPSVRFWRQARKRGQMPPVRELQAAQNRVGYQKLLLNATHQTVTLRAVRLQFDLGGIAKGYAVDEAMAVLKANGIERAYVAADSDLLVSGPPPRKDGWKIELRNVDQFGNLYPRTVFLKHIALSTSGDTEQSVEINGRRYSHIVDPRTGIGLTSRIQVTVMAPDSVTADSHATAVCVLGKQAGLQFADRRKLQALVLELAGERPQVTHSRSWEVWK